MKGSSSRALVHAQWWSVLTADVPLSSVLIGREPRSSVSTADVPSLSGLTDPAQLSSASIDREPSLSVSRKHALSLWSQN